MPRPILKWVGGKRQLLPQLRYFMPHDYSRYHEPFVGGGALFFDLERTGSYIADINPELINAYQVVGDAQKFDALLARLSQHAEANNADYYVAMRNQDRAEDFVTHHDAVARAARFIYLNKTCFNGVYRVNSKGHNNVPYGDTTNLVIDVDGLRAAHRLLTSTHIAQAPFTDVLTQANSGDLVYFDPPYVPLSATSSFTSYAKDGFTYDDQRRLVATMDALRDRGVCVMVSNSWTERTFNELYLSYWRVPIFANRMVNAKGDGRGKVKEMLAFSYPFEASYGRQNEGPIDCSAELELYAPGKLAPVATAAPHSPSTANPDETAAQKVQDTAQDCMTQ